MEEVTFLTVRLVDYNREGTTTNQNINKTYWTKLITNQFSVVGTFVFNYRIHSNNVWVEIHNWD